MKTIRFAVGALILCLAVAIGLAGAQGPPGKGKVEIDLSKLPPDLAKELLKYSQAGDKKAPAKPADKKGDEKDAGPPAGIPPAEAKGFMLAQFIRAQIGKGVTGENLAAAINKERAKLGLTDDDKDDDPPSPGKGKKE